MLQYSCFSVTREREWDIYRYSTFFTLVRYSIHQSYLSSTKSRRWGMFSTKKIGVMFNLFYSLHLQRYHSSPRFLDQKNSNSAVSSHASPCEYLVIAKLLCQNPGLDTWLMVTSCLYTDKNILFRSRQLGHSPPVTCIFYWTGSSHLLLAYKQWVNTVFLLMYR